MFASLVGLPLSILVGLLRDTLASSENVELHAIVDLILIFVSTHRLLPLVKFVLSDVLVQLLSELGVLFHSVFVVLMFSDEVETIHCVLGLVDSLDQTVYPDGEATVVGMGVGHRGSVLGTIIKAVLHLLDFLHKEFVDDLSCLGGDVVFNGWSPCELEEVLKHLNSVLNGADVLEGKGNLDGVKNFDLFDFLLENLPVVVVPLGDFYVEDVVVKVFDLVQVLVE